MSEGGTSRAASWFCLGLIIPRIGMPVTDAKKCSTFNASSSTTKSIIDITLCKSIEKGHICFWTDSDLF